MEGYGEGLAKVYWGKKRAGRGLHKTRIRDAWPCVGLLGMEMTLSGNVWRQTLAGRGEVKTSARRSGLSDWRWGDAPVTPKTNLPTPDSWRLPLLGRLVRLHQEGTRRLYLVRLLDLTTCFCGLSAGGETRRHLCKPWPAPAWTSDLETLTCLSRGPEVINFLTWLRVRVQPIDMACSWNCACARFLRPGKKVVRLLHHLNSTCWVGSHLSLLNPWPESHSDLGH